MAYRALNEKTLVDYLRGRPEIARRFPKDADLTVKEVGDGNLNLVFIVSSRAESGKQAGAPGQPGARTGQSVIAKQALNYLRVAGESWPLTRERMRFESQAMQLYNGSAPGWCPRSTTTTRRCASWSWSTWARTRS